MPLCSYYQQHHHTISAHHYYLYVVNVYTVVFYIFTVGILDGS